MATSNLPPHIERLNSSIELPEYVRGLMREFIRCTQFLVHTIVFNPYDKAELMYYIRRRQVSKKKKDAIAVLHEVLGIRVCSEKYVPEGLCLFLDSKGRLLHSLKFNQH